MFNEIKELFAEIEHKQNEIDRLEKILQSRQFTNIQIHFFADGCFFELNQKDTPFSLINELRLLIQETIQQHEIDIQNLKLQF